MKHAYPLTVLLLLATVTLLYHGWSLADGTVLDDHWHQKGLREHGWSPADLLRTLVIEPAQWMHAWWQDKPVRWEYGRPFFILTMKFVYGVLGGNDPVALHAFSILLHFASVCMVTRLCFLLTRSRLWCVVAGVLFAMYPHSVVTVAWPSSQNAVLQTTLMLAALLCYLRASRVLVVPASSRCPAATAEPPSLRRWPFAVALGLWTLALFTRENALMLPAILLAFDGAFGGRRHVRARRYAYAALAAVAIAFVIWRVLTITHPIPDVYVRRPAGDLVEYALWCLAKLLHYVCTSIWIAPMMVGPTGRFNPWVEAPGDCALMLAIVGVLGFGYFLACRRARGYWIWPLWIVLSVLPVVPVIATSHSGYMCGVGFALAVALAPASRSSERPAWVRRMSVATAIFFLLVIAPFSMFARWQWTGMIAAERYVTTAVVVSPPPKAVKDVFFINLPFVNIYAKPALDAELGPWFEGVNCHVLTYSPQPVLVKERCRLRQLDERSFSVRIEGQPYFSRLLGRFLIEAFRAAGRFKTGDVIAGDAFDVRIAEADEEGVRELVFTFPRPLDDPAYCFYLSTNDLPAARLRFHSGPGASWPAVPRMMLTELWEHRDEFGRLVKLREEVPHARDWAALVLRTDLYLTGPPFPGPR